MSDSKKAFHALERARTALIVGHPFYGTLALHLEVVEYPACGTMAVDGKRLYYNPAFVLSLTEQELVGVNAHEVAHCAYQHMTRIGNRDPLKWNYAADYVINQDLLDAGFTLPKDRLHDPKYKDMSTEEVYGKLPDPPKIKINVSGGGGKGGGQGQGKNQPGSGDADGEGEGQGSGTTPETSPNVGGCGAIIPLRGNKDADKIQEMAAEWETITRQAINIAAKHAGSMPGHLKRLAEMYNKPRVDWHERLRRFIDGRTGFDFSMLRPNKRYVSKGLHLPGSYPDRLAHLVCFLDTSGSVFCDPKLFNEFMTEIASTIDEGVCERLTVVHTDTVVQYVETYEPGDIVNCEPRGGGGTDFKEAMDWAIKNVSDCSAIIFFTDMYTCSFGEDPQVPVLWAAYGDRKPLEAIFEKVPFGECIYVDAPRQ